MSKAETIDTVEDFVALMGGTGAAATWAGVTDAAVSQWIARGCLPGGYHVRAAYEIRTRGREPGCALFDISDEQARLVFGRPLASPKTSARMAAA